MSTIIRKVQTLASAKEQTCIQSPVKHLLRSSSVEKAGLSDPHLGWDYLVFVTVNQVEVFSRNITHSVTIQLMLCAKFQMAPHTNVKWCVTYWTYWTCWTYTKLAQWFIEFDNKTAGLLFRLIELIELEWLIADSNFIYHKEAIDQFEVTTQISCLILKTNNHSILLPSLVSS